MIDHSLSEMASPLTMPLPTLSPSSTTTSSSLATASPPPVPRSRVIQPWSRIDHGRCSSDSCHLQSPLRPGDFVAVSTDFAENVSISSRRFGPSDYWVLISPCSGVCSSGSETSRAKFSEYSGENGVEEAL